MASNDKVLNLDELVKIRPSIQLEGAEHQMKLLSVEDFISATKKAQDVAKAAEDGESQEATIEMLISTVTDSFPTLTEEKIKAMSFMQLNAVMTFIVEVSSAEVGDKDAKK